MVATKRLHQFERNFAHILLDDKSCSSTFKDKIASTTCIIENVAVAAYVVMHFYFPAVLYKGESSIVVVNSPCSIVNRKNILFQRPQNPKEWFQRHFYPYVCYCRCYCCCRSWRPNASAKAIKNSVKFSQKVYLGQNRWTKSYCVQLQKVTPCWFKIFIFYTSCSVHMWNMGLRDPSGGLVFELATRRQWEFWPENYENQFTQCSKERGCF